MHVRRLWVRWHHALERDVVGRRTPLKRRHADEVALERNPDEREVKLGHLLQPVVVRRIGDGGPKVVELATGLADQLGVGSARKHASLGIATSSELSLNLLFQRPNRFGVSIDLFARTGGRDATQPS